MMQVAHPVIITTEIHCNSFVVIIKYSSNLPVKFSVSYSRIHGNHDFS